MSQDLWCYVEGNTMAFQVTTPSNANVSQLKKIICRECQHGVLHDINATDLLWISN